MKEYIEREVAKQRLVYDYAYAAATILDEVPAADVVEVKHGEWKERFAYDSWHYDCPFCDFGFATKIRQEDTPNYCEHCGAKMSLN